MPDAAVAEVTAGFDLSSEIGAALDAPAPAAAPEPAAPPAPSPDLTPAAPETPAAPAQPEAPISEPPAAPAEDKVADVPAPDAQPAAKIEGELPEGITIRDLKDGSKEYVLDQAHAGTILNGYQAAQAAEEVLGVPLTKDVATELYNDHIVRGRIESDLTIGGAQGAQRILDYFNNVTRSAITNGESQADGMRELAATMPAFLARANPEAFNTQYNAYTRLALDGLYQIAADSNDANLKNAVKWVDKTIFGTHRKDDAIVKTDPLAAREANIRQQETSLQQTRQAAAREQWNSEVQATYGTIREKVDSIVNEFTKPLEEPYKAYPKQISSIRNQLRNLLNDSVEKDANWKQQRNDLLARAQAASPGQTRKELLQHVANLTEQKARTVLNPARNSEVRAIINEAAQLVKAQNDAAIARADKAGQRRQPGPGGAAPDRSVLPAAPEKTGMLSKDDIASEIAQLLA